MRSHPLIIASLLLAPGVQAAGISVSGDWSTSLGAEHLSGGAGTDFSSPIESGASQAVISITNTSGTGWSIAVNRDGAALPTGVTVAVRRSGSGSCGNLVGGSNYQVVSANAQDFFSGVGDCSGIGIQLRFEGISVLQPRGDYSTTVRYTLQ